MFNDTDMFGPFQISSQWQSTRATDPIRSVAPFKVIVTVTRCPGNVNPIAGRRCDNPGYAGSRRRNVVHHHPPVYGFENPFAIAVVELEEGTRIVGNVLEIDPADIHIGMPVEVCFTRIEDEWTLPLWRPAREAER